MFVGRENKISADKLQAGETITIIGLGQSMTPILKSGQPVIVAPVTAETNLSKNDIVFCKVAGTPTVGAVNVAFTALSLKNYKSIATKFWQKFLI